MPLDRRYFSEPFASHLRAWCEEQERDEKAKADGTYRKPEPAPARNAFMDRKNAAQPPTSAQLAYLKKLGAKSLPGSRLEASSMIDELVKAKK